MLPSKVEKLLIGNERPESIKQVEVEMEEALAKGYKVPAIDFTDGIFTKQQARTVCCDTLGLNEHSLFCELYIKFRYLPLGQGSELSTLDQIVEDNENPFWEDEYPELSKRYLRISSIEAQHSYFHDKETDAVYDVGWEEMEDFAAGRLEPQWKSFYDFLEWYYSDDEE